MSEEQDITSGDELLVSLDDYLSNGIHVGLKYKTSDMKPFIYKVRSDKLCVFDVQNINDRLRQAIEMISHYKPEDILVVSNRVYGRKPIQKFCSYTGCKAYEGRFVSGSLTNPQIATYSEPKLLIVADPTVDQQAVKEASKAGVPVLAICDTNTRIQNIDFVIPANNKGKNSLALIFWILTKEVLKAWGIDSFDGVFEDFLSTAEPQPYLLAMQEKTRKGKKRR